AAGNSFGITNATTTGAAGTTGLDEREKELIRMKMENLEATKTIVDREHALHSGGTGAPGGSSGGGGSGGGWGGSIGISRGENHAKSNERTGKERTAADHRKAFSVHRANAAGWFRSFREELIRANILSARGTTVQTSVGDAATGAGVAEENSTAKRVLAIVRDAGVDNRSSGASAGGSRGGARGGGGGGGGKLNSMVMSVGGGGGMLGRGGNTSGTDAFTMTEVHSCFMALGSVLEERKRVMDRRAARDNGLIERGNWVGLQRAMEASKQHGQQDAHSTASSKSGKRRRNRRTPSSRKHHTAGTTPPASADGSSCLGPSSSSMSAGVHHYGELVRGEPDMGLGIVVGGMAGGAQHQQEDRVAAGELTIDVIPTSSSKRCHAASVALRATVDIEVLQRAHRTLAAWKRESVTDEPGGDFGRRLAQARRRSVGRGVMSRVPRWWWGRGGERVLALMREQRRKLREKGSTAGNTRSARRSATSPWRQGRVKHGFERTWKGNRWQNKIRQAQGKIRAIAKKRAIVAEQDKEEEVTPDTLRRDIDAKRALIISLSAKEKQCVNTIESARAQVEESRVYLVRIQSILSKYASYNMGKMDTLEREFQECSREQENTRARQTTVETTKKGKKRHPKRQKPGSSTKTRTTATSTPGTPNSIPHPITIPTSSGGEGVPGAPISPAPWPAEGEAAGSLSAQLHPAVDPSVSSASPTTAAKSSLPEHQENPQQLPRQQQQQRKRQQRDSPGRKRKITAKKKKVSPRNGRKVAKKVAIGTNRKAKEEGLGGVAAVAVVEATGNQEQKEQKAGVKETVVEAVTELTKESMMGLTRTEHEEELRQAKEARDLAEEAECRRIWGEEDAEEQEAWGATRGTEDVLRIGPELSKEEVVRLLATQYEQALNQTFEPERREAIANRIALVEAEQREKERKAGKAKLAAESEPENNESEQKNKTDEDGDAHKEEKPGDIGHLLSDPGLGLTRQEIDALFDLVDDQDERTGGLRGAEGGAESDAAARKQRLATRGLLRFLQRRGLRQTSKEPLEAPIGALSNSPKDRPPLKPELEDYISLNFVGGGVTGNNNDNEEPSAASSRTLSGVRDSGQGHDEGGGGTGVNDSNDGGREADDTLWRGSRDVYTGAKPSGTSDSSPAPSMERGRTEGPSGTSNNTAAQDADDCGDTEEMLLYPRTLGSSVSVLDEKDAVLRTGGARFTGEDPIRGRLRATDPFLWMGRLHAGATAISGLIDQATDALDGLEGGASDGDSVTSGGGGGRSSSDDRRPEGHLDWRKGVAGPTPVGSENTSKHWMKGGATGEQKVDDGWQTVGDEDGRWGGNNGEDEHDGDGKTHATQTSSVSSAAVEQISSTMSAYSQATEANRIITGGVVLEGEQEEDHENDGDQTQGHPSSSKGKEIFGLRDLRKRPVGSGPCPMRTSPVNARSAALGSSAKLGKIDTGLGRPKTTLLVGSRTFDIASSSSGGNDPTTSREATQQATHSTRREEWGEDESQDIRFDDIVSSIIREVPSRAPPTPRSPAGAGDAGGHDAMRPPWSAQERTSPTRRQRDGASWRSVEEQGRRPRSTPAGFRARAEAAATVLDRRPPWSLPLDSVFAPRVKGAVQPSVLMAPARRRFSDADSSVGGGISDHPPRQGMPPRNRNLVVHGASALRWQRRSTTAPSDMSCGIVPFEMSRRMSIGEAGAAGSAGATGTLQDLDPSADEPPHNLRRSHSASEVLLQCGLLQEEPPADKPPAMADGIWSWGWHNDGGRENPPPTAASGDFFTPLVTPEICKRSTRAGGSMSPFRSTANTGGVSSSGGSRSGTRAPSGVPYSRNPHPATHRSDVRPNRASFSHDERGESRPWTTGDFNEEESYAVGDEVGDEIGQDTGGLLRRVRSAEEPILSPHLANNNDQPTRAATPGETAPPPTADDGSIPDGGESSAKIAEDNVGLFAADEEAEGGQTGVEGATDDGIDNEEVELPGELPQQMPRRVSFADEQDPGHLADGGNSCGQRSSRQREGWGAQRRRMSSLIGTSNGYLESDGSINGHLLDINARRKSDLERCQKAMEIARAAHELLFTDTRPDGLRPITGTPMADGRDIQGSGGLYVGLAGLKGFDLSFVGTISASESTGRRNLGSVSSRLMANRRRSGSAAIVAAADITEDGSVVDRTRPPLTSVVPGASMDASWIPKGGLLDRQPGSLMARPPASPDAAPSPEAAHSSPARGTSPSTIANAQHGGAGLTSSGGVTSDPRTATNGSGCSPNAASSSAVQQRSPPAKRSVSAPGRGSSSEAGLLPADMLDIRSIGSASDMSDGSKRKQVEAEQEKLGVNRRLGATGRTSEAMKNGVAKSEGDWNSEAGIQETPAGTALVSNAANAMASLFAPKAAVLWSARNLGVEKLVFSAASDQQALRRPTSRNYTSRALLTAYKQAGPVFEVEASSWSKHEGAVAGIDYPLQPPAGWGGVSSNPRPAGSKAVVALSEEDRQGEWKAFERRPVSPAEAKAFREVVISRRANNRPRGSGGGGGQGTPLVSPPFSSDCSESTSRGGALEDNGSLMSSIADTSSEGSLLPEELRSKDWPKMPSGGSANAPNTWSKGVEQRQQENQTTSGRFVAALDNDRDTESVWSTSASSTGGTITPTTTPELHLVQQDNDRYLLHASSGIRSGGETQPSVLSSVLAPPKESPLAPSSGLGLDSSPAVNTESAFRFSCEADADDVLRAMVRLSIASTPAGGGSVDVTTQSPQGYYVGHASARIGVDERPAYRRRGNGAAAPRVPARYLSPAEGGSGGICRGSTPAIKSGHLGNRKIPYGNEAAACTPDEKDKILDIEGRTLRSGGAARSAGHLSQRRNERLAVTPDKRRSTTREFWGRNTAPQHGQRPSHRGKVAAAAAGRAPFVLSESQSAPSGISQHRPPPSSLFQDDSVRRGGRGNGGGESGGMAALESALRTLSASASSTSGVSRQLSSSSALFDRQTAVHDAGDSTSDERGRGSSSHSRVPIVGMTYGGSKQEKRSMGGTGYTSRYGVGQNAGNVGAKTGNEGEVDDGSSIFIGPIDPEASVTQSSCLTFGEGGGGGSVARDREHNYCDESDDKTTGDQMSMIIARVTRDAAASVLSAEGIITTEASLVTEDAEQLLSPAEGFPQREVDTTTAGAAEKSSRSSPQTTGRERLNPGPPKGDTSRAGKERKESMSRGKNNMPGSHAKSNQRRVKSASKPQSSRPELEERGGRGGARGDKSASASVGSSSAPAKLKPEQEAPKDRRSSLRLSKAKGPASGRGNAGEEMLAPGATNSAPTAGPPVDRSQGMGGGPEEASPADIKALAQAESANEKETGTVRETQTTDPPVCHVDTSGNPSGGQKMIETRGSSRSNAKRSQRGQDSSRGNRSNNAGLTASSGGGSPSSQGSSVVSRGSTRSGGHARGTESTGSTGSRRNSRNASGPNCRKDVRKGVRADAAASTKESLPALARSETTKTAKDGAQQQQQQDGSVAEKVQSGRATEGSETADVHKQLPRISSGAAAGGGRTKTASAAAGKTPHKAITVHKRPSRVENEDLFTTTEALTTHHLTVEELLKGGYDELLDDSDNDEQAGSHRDRTRKEPLMIPHRARPNGMAYWQDREEKERVRRRRPRSEVEGHSTRGGAKESRGGHGGATAGGMVAGGGDGKWEDEKEEIKRLLSEARARREAAVARVRAKREQAKIDSEGELVGQAAVSSTPTSSSSGNVSSLVHHAEPASSSSPSAAAMPGEDRRPRGLAAQDPSTTAERGETSRSRPNGVKGEEPPWKGFTLSDDGEALLRRRRAPSPEHVSPVQGREDSEYQLIVPGVKNNLVNFSVDTVAVRTNYGKLRRGVEIRHRMGIGEDGESTDYDDEDVHEASDDDGSPMLTVRTATDRQSGETNSDLDDDSSAPSTRERLLSRPSTSGAIPEISFRRRTGVQGGRRSNVDAPAPMVDPAGTIARASRIVTELQLDGGNMMSPLDSLRGDVGFDNDENADVSG
ncbi:unnamed protein product, partial [Ectocarpus fasciculatus]